MPLNEYGFETGSKNSVLISQKNRSFFADLIETRKRNGVDRYTSLMAALTALILGHKRGDVDELLP